MSRRLGPYVLSLALLLPLAARAATYPAVPPDPPNGVTVDQLTQLYYPRSHEAKTPTPADIVMYEGLGGTVVFKILNLTPYWMRLSDSSKALLTEHRVRDRRGGQNAQSFMFAPVGLPNWIPPGSTIDGDKYRAIANVHPRSFVLSWDSWAGVEKTHLNWVVEQVDYIWCESDFNPATCISVKNNQHVGLWVSYESPPPGALESGGFELMMAITEEIIAWMGVILDPLNPVAWIAAGFTTHGLVETGLDFSEENKKQDYGGQVYVSAYTIPDWNRECFMKNNLETWQETTGQSGEPSEYKDCSPSTVTALGGTTDGYDAGWSPYIAGRGPAALVVLTTGLRGQQSRHGSEHDSSSTLGSLPIVSVVVMTGAQYEAGQAGALLASARPPTATPQPGPIDLDKEKVVREARRIRDNYGDQQARQALMDLVVALSPEDRQILHDAVLTLLDRNPITKQQESFLLDLLKRVEKVLKSWRKEG